MPSTNVKLDDGRAEMTAVEMEVLMELAGKASRDLCSLFFATSPCISKHLSGITKLLSEGCF